MSFFNFRAKYIYFLKNQIFNDLLQKILVVEKKELLFMSRYMYNIQRIIQAHVNSFVACSISLLHSFIGNWQIEYLQHVAVQHVKKL